ncbi:hypothetical protein PVAND_009759 [Polypedilum vanderplanki]|uniref:CN hydrolase domain-containing protein n=1 Tax=Polypedilum vanderplanki TaxID=319348 RepID=A0A9J6CDQ6_POLVA|nr:hypothetical protein PVAND_009759 [Polypedilum vanderplanki]
MKKFWINFFGILTCWEYVNGNKDDFYTAAVVEFPTSPHSAVTNVESMIEDTLNEYLRLINEAAESGVDIVAFPEGTLNYVGIATRRLLIKHAVELSDGDIYNSTDFNNKCNYSKKSPIISRISLKSRENRIYVLINTIERVKSTRDNKAYNLYNTNIVFDRNGCIVSRYRKYNTKLDPLLNRTEIAQVQVFQTDFDVVFGHFTSLDIISKYPAYIMMQYGIQHILHPTLWYSSTPFYASLQLYQGFSYANNIALMVAGANNLVSGQGGSGIFVGTSGALVMYQPGGERMQQMIISKIPKHLDTYSIRSDNNNIVKRYNQKEMDQLFISVIPVKNTHALVNQEFKKVCKGKLCCEFYLKYESYDKPIAPKLGYSYRLSIFSGSDEYLDENSHEMHCAIVACTEKESNCGSRFVPSDNVVATVKFSEIHVSMTVELEELEDIDLMVMPTNIDFLLLPLRVDDFAYTASDVFNENNKQYKKYTATLLSETDKILTFGVLGRGFQLAEFHVDDNDFENDLLWWYLLSTMIFGASLMVIVWRLTRDK